MPEIFRCTCTESPGRFGCFLAHLRATKLSKHDKQRSFMLQTICEGSSSCFDSLRMTNDESDEWIRSALGTFGGVIFAGLYV